VYIHCDDRLFYVRMFEIPSVSLAYTLVLVLRTCRAVSEGVSVARIRKCGAYGAEDRVQRSSG